jgi:hypothetical protein
MPEDVAAGTGQLIRYLCMMNGPAIGKQLLVAGLTVLWAVHAPAQDTLREPGRFSISAYAECYYAYDFFDPAHHLRPLFIVNYNRHNEVNLNLGFLKGSYHATRIRGNMALMAGTYAQYNLTTEPQLLQSLYEANIGIRFSEKSNTWVDAGVLPSHIGFETPVGMDCWTLTRSIVADNTPYYETGLSVNHTSRDNKLYLSFLYLNGWQRIQRLPGVDGPAFGTQLTYSPDDNLKLNWSTYAGNEASRASQRWRFYNNVYAQFYPAGSTGVIAGIDIGVQAVPPTPRNNLWYATVIIIRQAIGRNLYVAGRAEYFHDPASVVAWAFSPKGFRVQGYSVNLDYSLFRQVMIRAEGRWFRSGEANTIPGFYAKDNHSLTACIALRL